jgi:hypothetical protein
LKMPPRAKKEVQLEKRQKTKKDKNAPKKAK